MSDKKNESPTETIDAGLLAHLVNNKGFRSETSAVNVWNGYKKKYGPEAFAYIARDFGYSPQQTIAPQADAQAASTGQEAAGTPSAPASAPVTLPPSLQAATGQPVEGPPGAPGTQGTVPPFAAPQTDTQQFYAAKAQAEAVASAAIGNTTGTIIPGQSGAVSIVHPSTDVPFGNPLKRVAGLSGPRKTMIESGVPTSMGNPAPVKISPQFGLPPSTSTAAKTLTNDEWKKLPFKERWKHAGDNMADIQNSGVVSNADAVDEATPQIGRVSGTNVGLDAAHWRLFRKHAKNVWETHPTTAAGWADSGQTYAWHAFNTWSFGAPEGLRGLYMALGGDPFWTQSDNLFYTDSTAFGEAMGALGDVTGMLMSPGKQAAKLGGGVLKGAGRVVGKDIAGGVEAVLYSKGIGKVTRGVNAVNNWNPVGQMMQSGEAAVGKFLVSKAVAPFGAHLMTTEAGKSLVAGVAEIIGKNRMRSLLGSRSAEQAVEQAASKAAKNTLASEWRAVRHDPLRNKIENELVSDAELTALTTFSANARKELGKVLGNADDATMQKLLDSMTDEFAIYLKTNPTATGLLKHPFGSGRLASKLQANKFVDITSRVFVDGALEAVGFGVQHLTASIGPYFEIVAQEAYEKGDKLTFMDYAKKTGDLWADKNGVKFGKDWNPNNQGNVYDSMTMGFVFGTKGLGAGHIGKLPWVSERVPWLNTADRNFSDLKRGLNSVRGVGKMEFRDYIMQLGSDGHAEVLNRMVGVFRRAGITVNPNAVMADELARLFKVAEDTPTGRKAIEKAIKLMRGDVKNMTDKQLAMFAAISRANAERFPIIMRDGRMYDNRIAKLNEQDIGKLYDDVWADDLANEGRLLARKNIEDTIAHENSIIEQMYKSESRVMFLSDLAKSSVVAGAIFLETGGGEMLRAMNDENSGPVEVANVMSHAMFSFMAGSHQRYRSSTPDMLKSTLDATKIGKDQPGWLQNRMRLSALQAQMHYGGQEVHPFIAYVPPPMDYKSIHLIAATGSVNDFVVDIAKRVADSVKNGKGYHAVNKLGDISDPANISPAGRTPLTHDELDQGLAVLKALTASGVPLPEAFNMAGYKPTDGQDYIDAINHSENRAEYLGHITHALRNMAIEGKYLSDGGTFKAEHFYRMTRLSAQKKIGEIASAVDYTATQLARLQSGVVAGRDNVLSPVTFENNPELTAQIQDFVDMAATLQSRYEIFKEVKPGSGTVSVKSLGDSVAAAHQMGRKALELHQKPISTDGGELLSAAEMAALNIIDEFHRSLSAIGVDPKLKLGTPGGELKNSLYEAVEMTGRFIAGELFHFRTPGGVVISGTNGKRLTVEGLIAAAEAAGLFSNERMEGVKGKRILRPISRDLLKELAKEDPQKAVRLLWLHDTLKSMTDLVYTPTDEAAASLTGMVINVEGNMGAGALLETSDLSKLFRAQKGGANRPGDAYNPIYHRRGFWGALEDAGIVINSREHAFNTLADLEGLKNMTLSESQRMTAAAIKIHKLYIKDAGGNRVIAPDVLLGKLLGIEDINGPEGVSIAAQALRNANGDLMSAAPSPDLDTPVFGPAEKSWEFRMQLLMREKLAARLGGSIKNLDGTEMTFEQQKALLFKTTFGVDLDAYIKMVDGLNDAGVYDGWTTDTGKVDGVPRVIDTKLYSDMGHMPLLQEALAPLVGISGQRRAEMVDNMTKVLRGYSVDQGRTSHQTVEQLVRYISSLGNAGDRTSMMRLRYLTEGVAKIVVEKDGQSIFTIDTKDMSQEAMSKMLDRYEALELGRGTSVDIITDYQRMLTKQSEDIVGVSFLAKPEKSKGATITHLFKEMRLGSTFNDAHTERFREVAAQLVEEFKANPPESSGDTEPFVDELMRRFKATFRQIGQESMGNSVVQGPVTKEESERGMTHPASIGVAPHAVEVELGKLSRADMIGIFDQVADAEVVLHLTASDAAAFDMAGVTLPEKGAPAAGDSPGETNAGMMKAPAPVGASRGQFSVTRKLRKADIVRQILDQLGSDRSIELDMHDDKTNTSLAFNRGRLGRLNDILFLHGLAKPSEVSKPNAIDETPDKNTKALKLAGRYGHEGDNTPIVLVPFGDRKLLAIQVPKDRAAMLTMLKTTKAAFDGTSIAFSRAKGDFTKLYKMLVDEATGELRTEITTKNGKVVQFESMGDLIKAGVVSHKDLYNAFATVIRANVHGTGIREDSNKSKTHAMDEALDVGSNKRYTQLGSDSYRKISDLTFSMAVNEAVRAGHTSEAELVSRGFVKQADGTWKIRVQLVAENKNRERGGVKEMDGNIPVARGAMDVLAITGGFDPQTTRDFRKNMQWAGWKGFIFGSQGDGFNFLTKSFMTSMDNSQEMLALHANVAMFVPMSSIKLGKPARGAMYSHADGPIDFTEAGHRLARGQKVELIAGEENIIEISPSDLKFQAMHDPTKLTATITAQLTQGMSHEAIKAFLDDEAMFPAADIEGFTSQVFDHSTMGQAAARAFYEKEDSVDNSYSPNDYGMGAMSLLDVTLMGSRGGTATPMFQGQIRQRVMKMAKERLFKGMSMHGGSAAMSPDASGSLKATEIILGPQARNALLNLKHTYLGVERTRHLNMVLVNGKWVVDGDGVEYTTAHADQYQQGTFSHRLRAEVKDKAGKVIGKIGKAWNFNQPSEGLPSDSVAEDRKTTWVDTNLNERASIDGNGHIRGFLAQIVSEIYAGGVKKGAHTRHLAPIYQLFDRSKGHIADDTFFPAAKIVNDMFVDVITAKSPDEAKKAVQKAVDSLRKGDENGPIVIHPEGDAIVSMMQADMGDAIDRLFLNVEARANGLDIDFGLGTNAGKGNSVGEMTNGDMFNLLNRVLGRREAADDHWGTGYDHTKRYVTDAGEDLYKGAGLTPVKYAIAGALQRSPSAKVNDTVLFHQLGFMEDAQGGLAIVNRPDAVDAMEADYDYDTFKFMFALPKETIGDVARLRNIIGPLGSQKEDTSKEPYTYLVDGPTMGESNQYLDYIKGQHVAAALKGQIISGKAVAEKMIADGRGFTYTVGKKTYRISPKWDLDTMQAEGMAPMLEIYSIVQKVLDTPGAMLPSNYELKDAKGKGTGKKVDLNNFDVDKEIFNRLYKKELILVNGTVPKGVKDVQPEDIMLSDDVDMRILRSVRTLISRAGSVMRDEQDGDTALSRNVDDMVTIAREYSEIFGDRLEGNPVDDSASKLRSYVLRTNRDMPDNIRQIIEGNKEEPGSGLQFHTTNKETPNGYIERVNAWVARIGDAMNGEYKGDPNTTGDGKMIRELATKASGDRALISALETMERIPAIRAEIHRIETEMKNLGGIGVHLSGQLDDLKTQLDDALMARTHLGTGVVTTNLKTAEGRTLNRRLVDGTIMGYSIKLTALGIDDTLDPRLSAMADMSARDIIKARNQMWGIASGEVAASNKRVKPTMIQDALNAIVENYMHQFTSGQEKVDMFDELAIRLLTPKAQALYVTGGQKFFSYDKMNQDIVQALMKYDTVRTQALLQKINRNSLLMSDVFSGDPVVGSLAMRDQIAAISSFDGRMGERKTMLRNIFKDLDVDNPIEEMMKENLVTRTDFEFGYNPLFDGIMPSGTKIKGVDRMLLGSIRNQGALENYRGRIVDITASVDRASVLDVPGIRTMLGQNWDSAILKASGARLAKAQRPFYQKLYADAVEDVQTQVYNERVGRQNATGGTGYITPPNMIFLQGADLTKAINQANTNFGTVMNKVMTASRDMTSESASKAIFRDSRLDVRGLSNNGIESAQAERERNCIPASGGN